MTRDLFTPRGLWDALSAGDRFVSIALIAGSVLLAIAARLPGDAPTYAVVTIRGETVAAVPLGRDARLEYEGRIGPVVVEVAGGGVRIAEATCPHRICVGMGEKHRSGEVIACVPNALLVRLTGGRPDDDVPDAVSR
jgi:hypothetical protein